MIMWKDASDTVLNEKGSLEDHTYDPIYPEAYTTTRLWVCADRPLGTCPKMLLGLSYGDEIRGDVLVLCLLLNSVSSSVPLCFIHKIITLLKINFLHFRITQFCTKCSSSSLLIPATESRL